jgi:hypothetical protein
MSFRLDAKATGMMCRVRRPSNKRRLKHGAMDHINQFRLMTLYAGGLLQFGRNDQTSQ